jgi:hypothetical protein
MGFSNRGTQVNSFLFCVVITKIPPGLRKFELVSDIAIWVSFSRGASFVCAGGTTAFDSQAAVSFNQRGKPQSSVRPVGARK